MAQQMLFRFGEEVVAPIQHRSQGPMPRQCRAAASCQQREAIVQCGG